MARNADSGTPGNRGARSVSSEFLAGSAELDALRQELEDRRLIRSGAKALRSARDVAPVAPTSFAPKAPSVERPASTSPARPSPQFQDEYGVRYDYQPAISREPLDQVTPTSPRQIARPEDKQFPTSTTDSTKPRTVGAWWTATSDDGELGTLTVVFRDGTPWNYYDVPHETWLGFRASISKGRNWVNRKNRHQSSDGVLLGFANGPAVWSDISESDKMAAYSAARNAQLRGAAKSTDTAKVAYRGAYDPKNRWRISEDVFARDESKRNAPFNKFRKSPGANPSANAGKNPNKNAGKHRNK